MKGLATLSTCDLNLYFGFSVTTPFNFDCAFVCLQLQFVNYQLNEYWIGENILPKNVKHWCILPLSVDKIAMPDPESD
jgi:hypothetical protein